MHRPASVATSSQASTGSASVAADTSLVNQPMQYRFSQSSMAGSPPSSASSDVELRLFRTASWIFPSASTTCACDGLGRRGGKSDDSDILSIYL